MDTVKKNRLKEALEQGKVSVGTGIYSFSPAIVEIAGYTGLDFVYIDTEHTPVDWQSLENLVRAAEVSGVTPIVRPEENDASFIRKCLEIGAQGVMVPHVGSGEEAERVIRAVRFPPEGTRGAAGLVRSARYRVEDWPEYMRSSNRESMVIVMIEDNRGIENLADILSVNGIDAVCVGFTDLSISLGLKGDTRHPLVEEAFDKVLATAEKNGVPVMCSVSPPFGKNARKLVEKGVRILIFGHDLGLLLNSWQKLTEEIREAIK